jgi:arylsulfatase A-like enzyme
LPKLLAEQGWETTLLTDDAALTTFVGAGDFEHQLVLKPAEDATARQTRALDKSQTAMAELFAAIFEVIHPTTTDFVALRHESAGSDRARLIWVHSRGMYGPWDAPLELQRQLLDEGDPPPVETVAPPELWLSKADDPDAVFRHNCAYASQIIVLDSCWNALMDAVDAVSSKGEWLVAFVGMRGFPLGEHRHIGGVDQRMFVEQLHVPWLIQFPNGTGRLARSGALTSHFDLLPTILDWTGVKRPQEPVGFDGNSVLPLAANPRAPWRDAVIAASHESRAIRAPDWCLRQDIQHDDGNSAVIASELYVRPDDRWEANDVAKLCPEVVESLTYLADDLTRQFREPR